MLLIAKLLFTRLLSGVMAVISFAMAHWRVVIPVLIAILTLLYINGLKRDIGSLEKVISDNQAQVEKDRLEAQRKEQAALTKVLVIEKSHKEQLAKLNLDRNRETNAIKAIYENKLNLISRNVSNRLPKQPAEGLPISASDTQRLATGESNGDSAIGGLQNDYNALESACVLTTLDFNALRAWADVVCETVECK
jgi:hypothetical protein